MVSKILNLNKFIVLLHSKRSLATRSNFFAKYRILLINSFCVVCFFHFRFAFLLVRSVSVLGVNSIVLMSHFNVGYKVWLPRQGVSMDCYVLHCRSTCIFICKKFVLFLFFTISCSWTLSNCLLTQSLMLDFSSFKNCS